jgi:hypothetical protein
MRPTDRGGLVQFRQRLSRKVPVQLEALADDRGYRALKDERALYAIVRPGGEVECIAGRWLVHLTEQEVFALLRLPLSDALQRDPEGTLDDLVRAEEFARQWARTVGKPLEMPHEPCLKMPASIDLPRCTGEEKMKPAKFRSGPLDGQRHPVPEHGPAWVLCGVHWYAHRRSTLRTYDYAGRA